MKLKPLVAALALGLVATGANAAFENQASGNSSLAFIALDSSNSTAAGGNAFRGSLITDLGFNLNDFNPAAGTKIEWLFGSNQMTVNGVAQAGGNWSTAFASFAAATPQTKWGVVAMDTTADGGADLLRIASTTQSTAAALATEDLGTLYNTAGIGLFNNSNLLLTGDASVATLSTATNYLGLTPNFGTAGKFGNNTLFSAFSNVGQSSNFFLLDDSNHATTNVTQYAGTFTYASGVLTYEVAAAVTPVPEPETYGMLLAGLGMIGFMARRRLNNRA